jgi:hypothetical protein
MQQRLPELKSLSAEAQALSANKQSDLNKRNELLNRLKSLPPAQFDQLLHLLQTDLKLNTGDIPGIYAEPTIRSIRTIQRVQQKSALEQLEKILTDSNLQNVGRQNDGFATEDAVRR